MFEKADPLPRARQLRSGSPSGDDRADPRAMRRSGGALRAVEWSEITARLNAARDLRMLLRHESQAPIESVTASFGDAAASYFALLDNDEESHVNPDVLEQSKPLDAMVADNDRKRPQALGHAAGDEALREKNND